MLKSDPLADLTDNRDLGLFLLRLFIGGIYGYMGIGKMLGGPALWENLGKMAMEPVGLVFLPTFFGFLAAFVELVGGLFLVVGFLTRVSSLLLMLTMVGATLTKLEGGLQGSDFYPLQMALIFLALIFVGPGRIAIQKR